MFTRGGLPSSGTDGRWIRTSVGTCILVLSVGATVVGQESAALPPSLPALSSQPLDTKVPATDAAAGSPQPSTLDASILPLDDRSLNESDFSMGQACASQQEPTRALMYYGRLLLRDPDHWPARLARARVLYDQREFMTALSDLDDLIRRDPKNAEAYWLRARIHDKREKFAAAWSDINCYVELKPADATAQFWRFWIAMERGDYGRPLACVAREWNPTREDEVTRKSFEPPPTPTLLSGNDAPPAPPPQPGLFSPTEVPTQGGLGRPVPGGPNHVSLAESLKNAEAHRRSGNLELARKYYDDAVGASPKDLTARFGRASVLAEMGLVGDATEDLEAIIRQQPDHAGALGLRSLIHAEYSEDVDLRILEFLQAEIEPVLELDVEEPSTRLARGIIMTKAARYDEAIEDLSWAIEHRANRLAALTYRGEAYLGMGDVDHALADLDAATRCCAGPAIYFTGHSSVATQSRAGRYRFQIAVNRGACYATKGDFDRAIADLTVALENYSTRASACEWRAYAYDCKGDLEHALADLEEVVRLRPEDPTGYLKRSSLLFNKGEFDRLQSDVDRLVQLRPLKYGPYFIRAVMMLLARHDWDRALADMDRALFLEPGVCPFYLFRSLLNAKKGHFWPTCHDLAVFLLTLDRTQFRFHGEIEWPTETELGHFRFELSWKSKSDPKTPKVKRRELDINTQCFELGIERLAAATFGASR
jgi:tetratricopeptide (TPR) repeat protein